MTNRLDTTNQLKKMIADFHNRKKPQEVDFRKMIPIQNLDRSTHFIHPYPAKLLQNIPIFFLSNSLLSQPGDLIFDPFCGSGTVLLEAGLNQRLGYGLDINPFAVLLAKVKCTPLLSADINIGVSQLKEQFRLTRCTTHDVVNSNYWYPERVRRELARLSNSLEAVQCSTVRDYLGVCLSAVSKKMSLADPRVSVPVRLNPQKYKVGHRLRRAAEKHLLEVGRNKIIDVFESVVFHNNKRMEELAQAHNYISPTVEIGDAKDTPNGKSSDQVQLIITSPPYPGAQKYIRSCSLSLGWLKLCPSTGLSTLKKLSVGREEVSKAEYIGDLKHKKAADQLRKIAERNPRRAAIAEQYLKEMTMVIGGAAQRLKNGGWFVLVAANNMFCGVEFMTQEYLVDIARQFGLSLKLQLIDNINSYGLMTKRNKTAGLISCEWVHVFQKD